jgi:uroporphyrinogen decarboxylase
VLHNPLRSPADVEALKQPDPRESVAYTIEAVRLVKKELADRVPLIGFSGAPFTLASYAIEGGSSRDYRNAKKLMYGEPQSWHLLMQKLTVLISEYMLAQVEAGADAVQMFDSWAGALSPFDFEEYVLPYVQQCIARVKEKSGVPFIYFGTDMNGLIPLLRRSGADVLGCDWRINLDEFWDHVGPNVAVQGNLDPATLFAPWPEIERRAASILDRAGGRPGHIFNLGHGILTETPVENVKRLVDFVHSYKPGQEENA